VPDESGMEIILIFLQEMIQKFFLAVWRGRQFSELWFVERFTSSFS